MEIDNIIFRDWRTLHRGEIISRLQYLPYHHPEARALRAAFSIVEDRNTLNQG